MNKYLHITFLMLSAVFSSVGFAQNDLIKETEMIYYRDNQIGGLFSTNSSGFIPGFFYRYGWHKTGSSKNIFETELAFANHPKEDSRYTKYSDNPSKFSYGRINYVFFLRNGFGRKLELTERPYRNSVSLNLVYSAGLSLALLKPVYIDVLKPSDNGFTNFVVPERYDPNKDYDIFDIYGNSSFFYGISETSIRPGAYGRMGLSIEYGQYPTKYTSIECGVTFDAFNKGLPMMAKLSEEQYFFGVYLALTTGWKR